MEIYIVLLQFVCMFCFCDLISGTGTGSKLTFNEANLIKDVEHMKKELSEIIEVAFEDISIDHMEFYYFRLHDLNRDQHLDGNELFLALQESSINLSEKLSKPSLTDIENYFADATDSLLSEADENDDGLISWKEYLAKTRNFVDN